MSDSGGSFSSIPSKMPGWLKYTIGLLGVVGAAGINIGILMSLVKDNQETNSTQSRNISEIRDEIAAFRERYNLQIQMFDHRVTINETRDMQQQKDIDDLAKRVDRLDRR